MILYKGASIYAIRKSFTFLTPSPLVRTGELVYTIKFTQPPLPCLLFQVPLPPRVLTSQMEAPQRRFGLSGVNLSGKHCSIL